MIRPLIAAALLVLGLGAQAQGSPAALQPAPAAPAAEAGVKSANVFELAPDASTDPNYVKQKASRCATARSWRSTT